MKKVSALTLVALVSSVLGSGLAQADCLDKYRQTFIDARFATSPDLKHDLVRTAALASVPAIFTHTGHPGRRTAINWGMGAGGAVGATTGAIFFGSLSDGLGNGSASENAVAATLGGLAGGAIGTVVGGGATALASGATFEHQGFNRALLGTSAVLAAASVVRSGIDVARYRSAQKQRTAAKSLDSAYGVLLIANRINLEGVSSVSTEVYQVIEKVATDSQSGCSTENVAKFLARSGRVCINDKNETVLRNLADLTQLVGSEAKAGHIADCKN